jgi:hypothetical protein
MLVEKRRGNWARLWRQLRPGHAEPPTTEAIFDRSDSQFGRRVRVTAIRLELGEEIFEVVG